MESLKKKALESLYESPDLRRVRGGYITLTYFFSVFFQLCNCFPASECCKDRENNGLVIYSHEYAIVRVRAFLFSVLLIALSYNRLFCVWLFYLLFYFPWFLLLLHISFLFFIIITYFYLVFHWFSNYSIFFLSFYYYYIFFLLFLLLLCFFFVFF